MSKSAAPWVRSRGLERLLGQETNVSDLIQHLSDLDPSPWLHLIGFIPDEIVREALHANRADLLLTCGPRTAVVEVKLGHLMTAEQQERYEALTHNPDLYLTALQADGLRVGSTSGRWTFISLSDLVGRWETSDSEAARVVATEMVKSLRMWDQLIAGVFESRSAATWTPLSVLTQKFLTRVVTRRIAQDLRDCGRLAWAGVSSGGGLPIVQGWTPIRGEGRDRTFIAEVRWWETKPGGELRFGVDFEPREGQDEDEEVRRAAFDLACSMAADIDHASLHHHLAEVRPDLAELLSRKKASRPTAKGNWERVIVDGFKDSPLAGGRKNNRRATSPGFYGDGALRFQAISEVNFEHASATDLTDLIDTALSYLSAREPTPGRPH